MIRKYRWQDAKNVKKYALKVYYHETLIISRKLKNKINSLSIEEKEGLNIENIYYNNIAIKRELGKWRFVSKILPKNMNEEGE